MSTNWYQLIVSMLSMQSSPELLTSHNPCWKNWNPTLCIRVWTNTVVLSVPQMSHKEMTSTLCQTPPAHIHLRHKMERMRQCIVSQSSLQSPRMQLEIPVILPFTEIVATPLRAAIKQHFEEHCQLLNSIHIDLIPHVGYQ